MNDTITPQELRTEQIANMWKYFHGNASDGITPVALTFHGKLATEYGSVVQQFCAELKEKGWTVSIAEVQRSWMAVFLDGARRDEIHLNILAQKPLSAVLSQ
jgi:hypothetical protein